PDFFRLRNADFVHPRIVMVGEAILSHARDAAELHRACWLRCRNHEIIALMIERHDVPSVWCELRRLLAILGEADNVRVATVGDDCIDRLAVSRPADRLTAGTARTTHAGIADSTVEVFAE